MDERSLEAHNFALRNALSSISIRLPVHEISSSKEMLISNRSLETRLNSIKIKKSLNRCNFVDNDPLSTSERPLEARNLALQDAFRFIPLRLPVPEISSCKGKGNFLIVYCLRSFLLLGPLARASSRWPIPKSGQVTDAIPGKTWYAIPGRT